MRTAFLVVQEVSSVWLGADRVFDLCLDRLKEIRGLEQIHVVGSKDLLSRSQTILNKPGLSVIEIPDTVKTVRGIWRSVTANTQAFAKTQSVLFVDACVPFLPAAKLESCLRYVHKKKYQTAMPARIVNTFVHNDYLKGHEPVRGVIAVSLEGLIAENIEMTVKTVPVSLIESLNVSDSEGLQIAEAVVANGSM